jgi:hypothetical protein
MFKRVLFGVLFLAGLGLLIWASDRVTLQGERTIYTTDCEQGVWQGTRCTGKLVAGARYRYRSLRTRREVVFWIAKSPEPSGKYTNCIVQDRDNWSCKASLDLGASITHEMVNGRAVRDASANTRPFHPIEKWKWWLMRVGVHLFHQGSY